jgi:xylulokinase
MTPQILAIDLGTGATKVAFVSLDGDVIDHDVERHELIFTDDGGVAQDPDGGGKPSRRQLAASSTATQLPDRMSRPLPSTPSGSGTVPVDASGTSLMNAITWLDQRGARYNTRIRDTFRPDPANRAIYDEWFSQFAALSKSNRKIHQYLNREEG